MRRQTGLKESIWGLTDRIPIVRETADPVMTTVLGLVIGLTIVGVCTPHTFFPHDRNARTEVLQLAGGLLVVLGAYYTVLGITHRRAHEYLERLSKLIEQLGSPSQAVRLGTIRLLQSTAHEQPRFPRDSNTAQASAARQAAILDALAELSSEDESSVAHLAREVREELIAGNESAA